MDICQLVCFFSVKWSQFRLFFGSFLSKTTLSFGEVPKLAMSNGKLFCFPKTLPNCCNSMILWYPKHHFRVLGTFLRKLARSKFAPGNQDWFREPSWQVVVSLEAPREKCPMISWHQILVATFPSVQKPINQVSKIFTSSPDTSFGEKLIVVGSPSKICLTVFLTSWASKSFCVHHYQLLEHAFTHTFDSKSAKGNPNLFNFQFVEPQNNWKLVSRPHGSCCTSWRLLWSFLRTVKRLQLPSDCWIFDFRDKEKPWFRSTSRKYKSFPSVIATCFMSPSLLDKQAAQLIATICDHSKIDRGKVMFFSRETQVGKKFSHEVDPECILMRMHSSTFCWIHFEGNQKAHWEIRQRICT